MTRKRTSNYGVIVYNVKANEYQKAIEKGKSAFRDKFPGQHPNLLHLPKKVPPDGLNFEPLVLADTPASPGTIIIGVG